MTEEFMPVRQLEFRTAETEHYFVLMVQPPPTPEERRTIAAAAKPFGRMSEQQMADGRRAFGFKKANFGPMENERQGCFNDLTHNLLPRELGNVALINGEAFQTPLANLRSRPSSMSPRFRKYRA